MTFATTYNKDDGQSAFRSVSDTFASMQARKPEIRNYPLIRDMPAIACVAITVIIMAYSSLFSVVPILIFYAIWLSQILTKGLFILRPSKDMALSLCLPLLCCLSALWSDYVSVTLHNGLEFVSMLVCTIIISRIVSTAAFVKGVTTGVSLVLVATLINGTYGRDYFSGTYSLVGLFGSKNQVGFISEIGILACYAIWLAKMPRLEKIIFALMPFILCAVSLYLSKSAAAVVTLFVVLGMMTVMFMVGKLPKNLRLWVVFISMIVIGAITFILLNSGLVDMILAGFGKDTTLTGRTYLWAEGFKIGLDRPILGHGYSAFWVPGQLQAERYWYEFEITGKTGFHFHELFVQSFVDLGVIGFLVMVSMIVGNLWKTSRLVITNGAELEYMFLLGISSMFLIRAFVEVDLLGPFGIGELLFFAVIPRLAAYQRRQSIATPHKS